MAELSEDQVKSAYVLNFVKFVEWPSGLVANDKVTLCIVGNNVLGGALAGLEGRKAGGRVLHVVQNAEENGCIGLLYRENKIVFEINLTSIQKSKFRLPAQLLNLASYVYGR